MTDELQRQRPTRSEYWILAMFAALIVLSSCGQFALAQTVRQPSGYFVMQEVGAQNIGDAKIRSAKFTGFVLREKWSNFNPTAGKYNAAFLDAQFARAKRLGKQVILAVYTGDAAPKWIAGQKMGSVPVPWSPQMLAAHDEMVQVLGSRYGANPLLVGVEIGGPTCPGVSLEMHPDEQRSVFKQKGYSEAAMLSAWKRCGDAYARAFPGVAIISDGGPFPAGGKATVTTAFWDYMHGQCPGRFHVSHCSLKANTPAAALHHKIVVDYANRGVSCGFEMVGPSLGGVNGEKGKVARFGGAFSASLAIAKPAKPRWLKVYQADEGGCVMPFMGGLK